MSPEWITAISSAVTAIATVGLVFGAFWAGKIAVQTLRQMKKDSADQTRPYVYAKLEPSMGGRAWDLVIRNVGQSSAKSLRIQASRWPTHEDDATRDLKRMFRTPRTLPPGTSIRTYWNLDPAGLEDGQTSGVTEPVTVRLTYTGLDEAAPPFADSFELDHTAVGMTPTGWAGTNPSRTPGLYRFDLRLGELIRAVSELRRNM